MTATGLYNLGILVIDEHVTCKSPDMALEFDYSENVSMLGQRVLLGNARFIPVPSQGQNE